MDTFISIDSVANCLTQQLNELEILKSMYPGQGEIICNDNTLLEINEYIDKKNQYVPSLLDYTIIQHINNLKLEICVTLPRTYPNEEPDLFVRCNQLNRQQETNLNKALSRYVKNTHEEGICSIYTAISWLQDNIDDFSESVAININPNEIKSVPETTEPDNFLRLWIYSHHIYNKRKRDEIVDKAKEMNVNGFCLLGKPGIICIEGLETNCLEWWRHIKSLSWKRIVIRKTEKFDIDEWKKEHKFTKFEEIYFQNANVRSNNKHADMSGLSKYLDKVGLAHAFNDFFGLCNDN